MHDHTSTDKHYGSATLLHAMKKSNRIVSSVDRVKNHKQHTAVPVSKENLKVRESLVLCRKRSILTSFICFNTIKKSDRRERTLLHCIELHLSYQDCCFTNTPTHTHTQTYSHAQVQILYCGLADVAIVNNIIISPTFPGTHRSKRAHQEHDVSHT